MQLYEGFGPPERALRALTGRRKHCKIWGFGDMDAILHCKIQYNRDFRLKNQKGHGNVAMGHATFLAVHVRAIFGALLGSSWGSLGHLLAALGGFWALLEILLASS